MTQTSATAPSRALTITQLVVSVLGILLSLCALLAIAIVLLSPHKSGYAQENTSLLLNLVFVIVVVILLAIPSVTSALRSLAGLPPRRPARHKFLAATIALLLIPVFLLPEITGGLESSNSWLAAIINILTVAIPIWWFLELGRLRVNSGSAQRQWGLYSFSTFITLPVILIVEIIVLGLGFLFGVLWLFQQPEFALTLSQVNTSSGFDPSMLEELTVDLVPLLARPGVVAVIAAVIALIIPLIEEFFKPLAMWFLHKRNLSPAEGFTIGMICGAAFALLESLFSISAVMPGDRMFIIIGRLGTGLLHIFTAGLNGWALAATWQDGRYLRVAISYGASVIIHGAWNLCALFMGLHAAGNQIPHIVDPALSSASVWALLGIAVFLLGGLVAFNRYLRREPNPPLLPPLQGNGLG